MDPSKIDPDWPEALRWFLSQDLGHFAPWRFLTARDEFAFAAEAFAREDIAHGRVMVFARRQDRDCFAGLELHDDQLTSRVVCFRPLFATPTARPARNWNIVLARFSNVYDFVARCVIDEMKDWSDDDGI